jgi:hypothetical protein
LPAESEGAQDPPAPEEIEETLQRLHELRAHLATATGAESSIPG